MKKEELNLILKESEGYKIEFKENINGLDEYPLEAIREAVINSVMHKYYFERGHNNILRFFSDKIRIENYWQKPPNFILGKTVFRRNQLIADLFSKIHYGEKMGTGFDRIRENCKKEKLPFPNIEFSDNYFYLTFKQNREYLNLTKKTIIRYRQKKLGEKLGENEKKILKIISKDIYTTVKKISQNIGISETAVENNIAKLKNKGLLKRIGLIKVVTAN